MKRLIVLACVALGMSAVAFAGKPPTPTPTPAPAADSSCQLLGTWFGIVSPDNPLLTGWVVSVTGQNNSHGTNNLEYPTFDPTLGGAFGMAARVSTLRGVWQRTGGNTFVYSFMGIAVTSENAPVWIGRVSGTIKLSADCSTELITAGLEIFLPNQSPFTDEPYMRVPMDPHYGQRVTMP
jgi:hypothetical protein